MKPLYESCYLNSQISNLKASLTFWDDLISKSNKLTTSVSVSMQCLSGFLEAFQKISDIAETNNAGLRPFGIALRRYCLRQRCVESRLRGLNSQITDCLVTPLSERLDEWRRTSSQMDRDYLKELRKAKSELQRATIEAEKFKKRLRRKQERGGVTAAFEKDDLEAPNVQINFVQHDLAHKHRALERLEQRCLEAVAVEERRRFTELSTCLNPLLDAQMSILEELGPLEEALKEIRAAHPAALAASVASSQNFVSKANNGNHPLDATIATGSAALSFAVTPAPSTLSITSTSTTGNGYSSLFGHADSVATLHSPDADGVSRMHSPPSQLVPARHGCAGSPGPTESLVNGARSGGMGGDALSLFDHNQSISGAPTVNSSSSCSSLGLLPLNCDAISSLGSMADSTSPNAHGDISIGSGPNHAKTLNSNNAEDEVGVDEEEDEDGGTTEGCLTEDDENEETLNACPQSQKSSSVAPATTATSTVSAAMEKSILYPNQSLPPPVYTNFSKLQAAAQRGVGSAPKDPPTSTATPNGKIAETPSLGGLLHSAFEAQSEGRKLSQPTATILKGGVASLLRSLSISGRSGFVSSRSPPSTPLGLEDCEGAGEGLSLSPPQTSPMTPIIADQALLNQSLPPSAPNSPSSTYFEARSRTDGIFSTANVAPLSHEWTGFRCESPPPTVESPVGETGTDAGSTLGGGAGIVSGFCRRRLQQQVQSQQRTNLLRGSMFQLNTKSTADATTLMDMDRRYGCGSKQTPMTPGPGRRAPMRTPSSTLNETGQVIRPPRRSSSVCRELPSLCNQKQQQQQQQQQQQVQHFFPSPGSLPRAEHQQQNLNNSIHYATPRGVQQHPKCVYADPRTFQHSHQLQQPSVSAVSAITTAAAAQLAAEAAATRRHQQLASSSGLCNSITQRAMGHMQNGSAQSRLPQRQTVASASTSNTVVSTRANNPRAVFVQQQQQPIGVTPTSGASLYGHNHQQQQHHPNHQNSNYLQKQQLLHHEYPPPPAAFDDVESTSFIETSAPPSLL